MKNFPLLFAALIALLPITNNAQAPAHKTENVIIVMMDGLRWQEVFNGVDAGLIDEPGPAALQVPGIRAAIAKQMYARKSAAESREALMPFLWTVMAKKGQIFGNRALGSDAHVTNPYNFSYPGYNETLTGYGDPAINSNDNKPNPNVTVFEWLNKQPGFEGKVAAFGAWENFDGIFNKERCGFTVNAGYDPLTVVPGSPELELLNKLKMADPRVWPDEAFDGLTFYTALEYIKAKKPRVVFIGLGETDDWAHADAYPSYLHAAHHGDAFLAELWQMVQQMPEYMDKTTLIVLPDHGRGTGKLWTSHGEKIAESRETWMAFLGPDTQPLGERGMGTMVTESQVAATVAILLGEDFRTVAPKAGKAITDVVAK